MSLGLVVLEKKLFTRTRTPTPQSDDIKTTPGIRLERTDLNSGNRILVVTQGKCQRIKHGGLYKQNATKNKVN